VILTSYLQGNRLNPVAATFTPRTLAKARQLTVTETSEASTISTTGNEAMNASSQTSRQWSDEVAEQEEQAKKQSAIASRP
jgi:hypothetical protein